MKMQVGNKYVIYVYIDDESFWIVVLVKVDCYLFKEKVFYQFGEEVNIFIWQKIDFGFKVIIENMYSGLLYDSEIFQILYIGDVLKVYVKQVCEDGKIDLIFQKLGFEKIDDFLKIFYCYIIEYGGWIGFIDKSFVEEIYDMFGVSKKIFKKVVGDLYKKCLIFFYEDGIELVCF